MPHGRHCMVGMQEELLVSLGVSMGAEKSLGARGLGLLVPLLPRGLPSNWYLADHKS